MGHGAPSPAGHAGQGAGVEGTHVADAVRPRDGSIEGRTAIWRCSCPSCRPRGGTLGRRLPPQLLSTRPVRLWYEVNYFCRALPALPAPPAPPSLLILGHNLRLPHLTNSMNFFIYHRSIRCIAEMCRIHRITQYNAFPFLHNT